MEFRLVNQQIKDNFLADLDKLPLNGNYMVYIKPAKRSLPQNNLFHEWIGTISKFTGLEFFIQKAYYKVLTWGVITIWVDGKETHVPHESSKKNVKEFSELLNVTEKGAREMGVKLRMPSHFGY